MFICLSHTSCETLVSSALMIGYAEARHTQELLQAEQAKTVALESNVRELQANVQQFSQQVRQQEQTISALQAEREHLVASISGLETALQGASIPYVSREYAFICAKTRKRPNRRCTQNDKTPPSCKSRFRRWIRLYMSTRSRSSSSNRQYLSWSLRRPPYRLL